MKLPFVNNNVYSRPKLVGAFGGLNQNEEITENEFADMDNVSLEEFPIVTLRENKTKLNELTMTESLFPPGTTIQAAIYLDGLFIIANDSCAYKGVHLPTGKNTVPPNQLHKLVRIGVYILLFPIRLYFDTKHPELGLQPMEMHFTNFTQGSITSAKGSVFFRINSATIGQRFAKGDSVFIQFAGLDILREGATKVIVETGADFIVLTGSIGEVNIPIPVNSLTVKRTVPHIDYVCENNNRIWACNNATHEVYSCKLGDFKNWQAFEQISTDSYVATIGTPENFTGCIAHLGHVLFFKENAVHKIFGDKPNNFQIKSYENVGVKEGCYNTLVVIKETLYYVGVDGVYSYDGAIPEKISGKIEKEFKPGFSCSCAGKYRGRYYLMLNNKLFIYHPDRGLWTKHDNLFAKLLCDTGSRLLFLNGNDYQTFGGDKPSGEEKGDMTWRLESGGLKEETLSNKYIKRLMFHFFLLRDSYVDIFIKYDNDLVWDKVYTIHSTEDRSYIVPIIPRRHFKMSYKLEGKGDFKLLGISKNIETGSEVYKNGNF
jgi:hypothetical protein